MLRTLIKITFLGLALSYVLVSGMNCSPNAMQSSVNQTLSVDDFSSKPIDLPLSLQNAEQTLISMQNVTGIKPLTGGINNEFSIRSSSLSDRGALTVINAPLFLSSTSLAGEFCNALIAKEKPMPLANRQFFKLTNFSTGPDKITSDEFSQTIDQMSTTFWGRAPASEEKTLLTNYYMDYVSSLDSANRAKATQTSGLYLSICAAMLSSFQFLTF